MPDKSNLQKEGFILALSSKVSFTKQSSHGGRGLKQLIILCPQPGNRMG